MAARCETDSRMHTALIEVCTRTGDTARALAVYEAMRDAEPHSRLTPSVHAFTSAMRAAAEVGLSPEDSLSYLGAGPLSWLSFFVVTCSNTIPHS